MDLSGIQPLLDWLSIHQQWVALAIILIAFLESLALAGVVIPGVLLLFGASAVAGNGVLGVWTTMICAFTGAVLGDGISFFLGKSLQHRVKQIWPFRAYPDWISNGEMFFARHGGKSVVMGRFVGPIRPVIPMVAGMLGMNPARFISINLLSALAWAPVYVLPGYLFGSSLTWGQQFPAGFSALLGYSLGLLALIFVLAKLTLHLLHRDAALYRGLQNWADNQHNVRLFWYWLGNRRQGHHFPLPSLIMVIGFSLVIAVLVGWQWRWVERLDARMSEFFIALHHPWLDIGFMAIVQFFSLSALSVFSAGMISWLLFRSYFAAALHSVLALALLALVLTLMPYSSLVNSIAGTALCAGLVASFVAQEWSMEKRWWILAASLAPILLAVLAKLYLVALTLSEALIGVLTGLLIAGLVRLSYSRFDNRPLQPDLWFWLLSLAVFAAMLLMAVYG